MQSHIDHRPGGTSFVGKEAVDVYAMTVIASGLLFYARTGMKPNRAYTPKAMMQAAEKYTGKKFKARAYLEAAEALTTHAYELRATIPETTS
jgi:hypothetical protein